MDSAGSIENSELSSKFSITGSDSSGRDLLKASSSSPMSKKEAVKAATRKENIQKFIADQGNVSGVLKEGTQGKVTAFLQRHSVARFLLGGAARLAAIGLFAGAGIAVVGATGLTIAIMAVPAAACVLFPPTAPAGLLVAAVVGSVLGAFACMLIGPVLPATIGVLGVGAWNVGDDILKKDKTNYTAFRDKIKDLNLQISDEEITQAEEHLKRANVFTWLRFGQSVPKNEMTSEDRVIMAFRIKHSPLTLHSKTSLLNDLATNSIKNKAQMEKRLNTELGALDRAAYEQNPDQWLSVYGDQVNYFAMHAVLD